MLRTQTLTETKKLVVPSVRANVSGNNLSHVSSPNMISFPSGLSFNWDSQVSWFARVEVVSDSAKLRITSRNDGIDPVVIAFTLGIVIVGEVACAVKGIPDPDRMRLKQSRISATHRSMEFRTVPLSVLEARIWTVHKIAVPVSLDSRPKSEGFPPSERIDDHENDLIKRCDFAWAAMFELSKCCFTCYERFIGKKPRGKD